MKIREPLSRKALETLALNLSEVSGTKVQIKKVFGQEDYEKSSGNLFRIIASVGEESISTDTLSIDEARRTLTFLTDFAQTSIPVRVVDSQKVKRMKRAESLGIRTCQSNP